MTTLQVCCDHYEVPMHLGLIRVLSVTAAALTLILALTIEARGEARVEVVARGLEVPWAIGFAPDGRLFVTERPGRIRVMKDGRLDPIPVATLPVTAAGEGGLMGLALDPAFDRNSYLYACYTASTGIRPINWTPFNRVVRLTVRDGRASDERVLIDRLPGARNHNGCRLKFGPDGKLYVTTGDAGDAQLAQRLDSLAGKILRLNPDGTPPEDNPISGSPVYSFGHRNPQGLAWDPSKRLFAAEHGPSAHDEVNYIRPGLNYGWPQVIGRGGDPRYADPLIESGNETWAPSGIAALGGDLFVAALRGQRLLRLRLGPEPNVTQIESLLIGTHGRLRDVVVGPDRLLYVTTSNRDGRGSPAPDDDRILRVTP